MKRVDMTLEMYSFFSAFVDVCIFTIYVNLYKYLYQTVLLILIWKCTFIIKQLHNNRKDRFVNMAFDFVQASCIIGCYTKSLYRIHYITTPTPHIQTSIFSIGVKDEASIHP